MDQIIKGSNELGDYFVVTLDKDVYGTDAVMKTCYILTEQFYIHVTKSSIDKLSIYFYDKKGVTETNGIDRAAKEFLDVLLENQMRQIVLNETKNIHDEIVRRAFSPAAELVHNDYPDDNRNILVSSI